MWYSIATIILGFIGFWICDKIITMKKKPEPMVCPVGYECDDVIRGPYSKFFGVSTVHVGRVYYLLLSAFYALYLFLPMSQSLVFAAVLISGLALLFSVYLTALQLFVIRKWCSWCLMSALTNLLIFSVVFSGFAGSFAEFLFNYRDLLQWLFVAATLVGTLVTTLHSFTFVKFLKDFEISRREYKLLGMYSHTAWVALGIAFLAGLGLTLTDAYGDFTGNSEFLVMAIILGVLAIYELVQNTRIAPRLIDIHFGDHPELDDAEHNYQRKMAFSFVAVGLMSWYLLMLFSNLSWHEFRPLSLVGMYIIVIVIAVIMSLLVERVIYRKSLRKQ
jgi:uncharacterized membrane protein